MLASDYSLANIGQKGSIRTISVPSNRYLTWLSVCPSYLRDGSDVSSETQHEHNVSRLT